MKKEKIETKIEPNFATHFLNNKYIISILIFVAIMVIIKARLHLLSFPLERDEGEYAIFGSLILDGHSPYSIAYNMKLPGTYYMYALIMGFFGKTLTAIHLGLMILVLISMILLYFIAQSYISKLGAVVTMFTFGILGTSWTILGQAAHATHFVSFFALCGITSILWKSKSSRFKLIKIFFAGIFFSLAFICKQSGLFFVILGAIMIFVDEYRKKMLKPLLVNLLTLGFGFVLPIAVMIGYFYFFGNFEKFWFWTITYLQKYGSQVPISEISETFSIGLKTITANYSSQGYTAIWLISLLGIPLLLFSNETKQKKIIILSFFCISFLTVLPGFYFRPHYFITMIPVISLLVGIFFDVFNNLFTKVKLPNLALLSLLVYILFVGAGVKANENYLFKTNPDVSSRKVYGLNPFYESLEIAEFIKENSEVSDKIAIVGSEPQIYFYSDRFPATGYIYTYGLMEDHDFSLSMQKEMIEQIESNNPEFLLFVNISTSWLKREKSEDYIFEWVNTYINKNYELSAMTDMNSSFGKSFISGEALKSAQSKDNVIWIFKRKIKIEKTDSTNNSGSLPE